MAEPVQNLRSLTTTIGTVGDAMLDGTAAIRQALAEADEAAFVAVVMAGTVEGDRPLVELMTQAALRLAAAAHELAALAGQIQGRCQRIVEAAR